MANRLTRIATSLLRTGPRAALLGRATLGTITLGAVTLGAALSASCKSEDKESEGAKSEATATASTAAPVLDNKIANAVAQAAKTQAQPGQAADNGPPQDGIMGAARADAELAKGAPAKVKLGSSGSEPRTQLGAADWGDKRPGQLEISVRNGPGAMPTTVLKLEVRKGAVAASAPASTATPGAAPVGAAANGPLAYLLDVVNADLATTQPGEVPPQLGAEIRKLKGSQFGAQVGTEGLIGTPTFTLAKGAIDQLDSMLDAGATTLNDAIIAYPKEPVGAGGFWMTTSRETLLGAPVIVYRMIKVSEIKDGNTVLDVSAKRYLAAETLGVSGLEQAKVVQFQAESSTQMMVPSGSALPLDGRAQTSIRAFVEIEGQPRPIQVESRSLFAFAPPAAPAGKK
jgi:hypothetical protein